MNSFIENLKRFLKSFPDNREIEKVKQIKNKSKVLYLGLNLKKFLKSTVTTSAIPIGIPGWPELAFWTASIDKNLIAFDNWLNFTVTTKLPIYT